MTKMTYVVIYKDSYGKTHMHFCIGIKDVRDLEMNVDVISIEPCEGDWYPESLYY